MHADIHLVGHRIARVHAGLSRWLRREEGLAARAGGRRILSAQVTAPAEGIEGFDFDYYNDRIRLGPDLLARWGWLFAQVGARRWEEVVRLFLLHEGHHIGQGLAYTCRDIGRAGVALEAADYDADVASVETCLQWRRRCAPLQVARRGEMGTLAEVLDNLLWGLALFEEGPLDRLKERRLRRHLIWHFQRARARAAPPELPAGRLRLAERVVLEAPGLVTTRERRGGHEATYVRLDQLPRARDLELVIYVGGRLYRRKEIDFCRELLSALRQGPDAERVSRVFNRLFEEHPGLVPA